jgi:hypothetical protein
MWIEVKGSIWNTHVFASSTSEQFSYSDYFPFRVESNPSEYRMYHHYITDNQAPSLQLTMMMHHHCHHHITVTIILITIITNSIIINIMITIITIIIITTMIITIMSQQYHFTSIIITVTIITIITTIFKAHILP